MNSNFAEMKGCAKNKRFGGDASASDELEEGQLAVAVAVPKRKNDKNEAG